jgi:hypothetical protein
MRGATGAAGIDGPIGPSGDPGIRWRGQWRRSDHYEPDDAVQHKGSSYIAIAPSKGHEPPTAGAWDLLAAKGDKGDPGFSRVVAAAAAESGPAAPPGEGAVPVGGIIMWSGTIATIPVPDWQLCDGTANAPGPDLRDKFVVGASVDAGGVAKTTIEGAASQSATQTGATLAAHADHTGLSHDGSVASHADLTHAALSHPAFTVVHADHSLASQSHTHASGADVSLPSGSFASTSAVSYPSHSHASAANASAPSGSVASSTNTGASATGTVSNQAGVASFASGTNRSGLVSFGSKTFSIASHTHSVPSGTFASTTLVSVPSSTGASGTNASAPSGTIAAATGSRPSLTGSDPAVTVTHADHSIASLSHQAIGTHSGLSHAFTPPASHGAAGTLTHSAHATVPIVPAYYALAFIQRML